MPPFFYIFRLGNGAARFGQAIIVLVLVLMAIGLVVGGVRATLDPGADARAKEVQCYAGDIAPPPGGDCINYVHPDFTVTEPVTPCATSTDPVVLDGC